MAKIKSTNQNGTLDELEVLETYTYDGRALCVATAGFMVGVFDKLTGGKIVWFTGYPEPMPSCISIAKRWAADTLLINPQWKEIVSALLIINPDRKPTNPFKKPASVFTESA